MVTSVYQDQDQDHGGCDVEGTTGMGHWTLTFHDRDLRAPDKWHDDVRFNKRFPPPGFSSRYRWSARASTAVPVGKSRRTRYASSGTNHPLVGLGAACG